MATIAATESNGHMLKLTKETLGNHVFGYFVEINSVVIMQDHEEKPMRAFYDRIQRALSVRSVIAQY